MKITGDRLTFFSDLYEEWHRIQGDGYERLKRHLEQYNGSKKIDGSDEDALVVRNITYEIIEAQITTNMPAPRVTPKKWSEGHSRSAKSAENYLVTLRDELPFERDNDSEERMTYIYGGAAIIIEWDNSYRTHYEVGRPAVRVINPDYIVGQPGVYEIQDMDACFVRMDTTREDIMSRYGVEYKVADSAEPDEQSDERDETVAVYTCWYFNESGFVSKFVWSGGVVLEDVEDYWSRKKKVCASCGKDAELGGDDEKKERCACGGRFEHENEEYEELTHDIVRTDGSVIPAVSPVIKNGKPVTVKKTVELTDESGNLLTTVDAVGNTVPAVQEVDEVRMEATRIKWYRPNLIPIVIRVNIMREKSLLGQSDCEFIRPYQQEINKIESRIHEKIMKSGVYPVVPAGSRFEMDNSVNEKILRLEEGEHKNMYGSIDTRADISSDIAQAERVYDMAKRTMGITDSFLGQADNTAKSGYAKQIQVQQSAGRLSSKRAMKEAAWAQKDQILFQYALAYADEPRPFSYTDEFGYTQNGQFNRYDFLEVDESTGEWYYDDGYTFGTDRTGGVDTQSEQMWQLISQDFSTGLYGAPEQTSTRLAVWLARERAGYPGAHTQVKYFKAILQAEKQAQEVQMAQAGQTPQGAAGMNQNNIIGGAAPAGNMGV